MQNQGGRSGARENYNSPATTGLVECAESFTMRLIVYLIGFMILIGGLAWAAITAGAPTLWVEIGGVILLGLGIVTGVSRTSRAGRDVTVVNNDDRL